MKEVERQQKQVGASRLLGISDLQSPGGGKKASSKGDTNDDDLSLGYCIHLQSE